MIAKLIKPLIVSLVIALITRAVFALARKANDPATAEKVDQMIDTKSDKAKKLAKEGVHKAMDMLDEVLAEADTVKSDAKKISEKSKATVS